MRCIFVASLLVLFSSGSICPCFAFQSDEESKKSSPSKSSATKTWPDVQLLKEYQIDPSEHGIRKYIAQLTPAKSRLAKIQTLIKQLNSDRYQERNDAYKELTLLTPIPDEIFNEAIKSNGPETIWRCDKLQRESRLKYDEIFTAILRNVSRNEFSGLLQDLLRLTEFCSSTVMQNAAEKTILKIAKSQHLPFARELINSKRPFKRLIGVSIIGKFGDASDLDEIAGHLKDVEERVQLRAAHAFANVGDRRCLKTLVMLLESEVFQNRFAANHMLKQLTQKDFGFSSMTASKERKTSLEKWKKWLNTESESTKLHFPVTLIASRTYLKEGHTLLAYGHRKLIEELDATGEVIWKYEGLKPWSAEKLPNGNVLVAAGDGKIAEINMRGETVWEYQSPLCLNAKLLPNGNFLCVSHTGNRVFEITRKKKIVVEFKTKGLACDAHRLENGNTLIAEDSLVKIVDTKGEVVWSYDKPKHPYGVEPLPNGNILICDLTENHVIEVTREKRIVWKFPADRPCDAFRLPNGNTLITDHQRFVEVDADKNIVWEKRGAKYGTARR